MGSPSTPTQQNVTSTTSNLPEYARPYFENMMNRAQAQSYQQYTPYSGQRIAGFTPAQQQIQQNTLGMGSPNQFGTGSALAYQAGLGALNQKYDPKQFNASSFGGAEAKQYMSPYAQNVMDVQKREATRDAQKSQLAEDLGAARQGTYGGSRQLLASLERERNLGTQLGDIQARGQQAAYENAQSQFERDRMAGMESQRLSEQSRQFGAGQGLAGLQAAGQMGQTLGNLGQYQQNADIQRLGAQGAAAGQQQQMQQQYLDQQYGDFLRQRDYPMEQLGYFSNLLRGLPMQLNSTQTSYAPPPSVASQLLGGGLGAYSTYKMLQG